MEFRILGPVEIHDERSGVRIALTGAKQRALLGALIVKRGQVVSAHRLIDELWGHTPPANATNALQAHVMRLRRLLPVPVPGSGEPHHEWIVTRSMGYVLRAGRAGTDAGQFHQLAAEGRAQAVADPEEAAGLLRRALALWRGAALEGAGRGDICSAEAAQLEEGRLTVLETLYDVSLRAGRHGEITGELEELTADHPMRERFYDLLMTALYRCGRQAEALSVYDRARKRLVHELGVEPGPALRGRMEAILHHDPGLDAPACREQVATVHRLPSSPDDTGSPAAAGLGASVLSLSDEIARLRSHVERLSREQQHLMHRFDQLTAPPAAGQ
ncbi:BTAD domain-containing putative transcriptional regulator [Streptomyces sp. NPDC002659]|uniref:AfsR/SARP family transcriptional regulator n=1 Tax=unclassified Streptomyces TaxID=2593676 RepID=UPI0036A3D4B8|nr:AfsR/SARP family transcriptional regulator [Streptomyces sp. NBC_00885]